MKKLLILTALIWLTSLSLTMAQSKGDPKLGIGLDFSIPLGSTADVVNYGTGASLLYQQPLAEQLRFSVSAGYIKFNGKEVFVGIKYREGYIPIKAGLKYFVTENIYGSAEAGVALSTANGSGTGTAFAYAPGVGAEFPLGDRSSLDFGLRYEGWARSNGTRSFAALRAGFNF